MRPDDLAGAAGGLPPSPLPPGEGVGDEESPAVLGVVAGSGGLTAEGIADALGFKLDVQVPDLHGAAATLSAAALPVNSTAREKGGIAR